MRRNWCGRWGEDRFPILVSLKIKVNGVRGIAQGEIR